MRNDGFDDVITGSPAEALAGETHAVYGGSNVADVDLQNPDTAAGLQKFRAM
jgi:hypothetical protein